MKRILRLLFLHLLALLGKAFVRAPTRAINRLLYIKPDHLGDLLLATPALAALRQRLPAAHLVALVGPWSQMVLAHNPDINALLLCPFPGFTRATMRPLGLGRLVARVQPYLVLLRYAALLRSGQFDAAIIGRDDHWWGAALALLAGIPQRVGFAVPECRPFLTDALAWDAHAHVTRQGLALVDAIKRPAEGIRQKTPSTRFDPAASDIAWAAEWLRAQGVGPQDRLLVIHPGTGGPAKLWLPERWARVADALLAGSGSALAARPRLLLTGGPGEEQLVAAIAGQMLNQPLTLAGQTTVGQLAALLRHAHVVLGVDSGPLHLAAAQNIPTIHLYGPGDDRRFGPWGNPARHIVLRSGIWCSPCGVFGACPRGLAVPECMEQIEVEEVLAVAGRMLAR